jgi:predicted AAA+ superfamily ATPase
MTITNRERVGKGLELLREGLLKPWREVVTPHHDVTSGQYVQAEFAADLHNVHHGLGSPEYSDPAEFFRRTYITAGIRDLLTGALQRLTGKGGDPVVELQTNFGGGKTHAMLALYHLFSDVQTAMLSGVEPILQRVELARAPVARRAVLVGTHLSVGQVNTKPDGTKVHTLWGEMAWELGGAAGYAAIAASDQKGVSPGARDLRELLNRYAPCLVLIDEWVAYARNTVDRRDLPAGAFEAQATFAQALTEAAKGAVRALVVVSIPSSEIEFGGAHGKFALQSLKDVIARIAVPWRPASAEEGFEIVRRRLFEPIRDKARLVGRDVAVEAFSRMYAENKADFPNGTGEGTYKERLRECYPIHPDVFDLLYGEWSTLDKFQRTRGVLRLLAKVIQRLWEAEDAGPLILPASIPMGDPGVKSELTRYLEDVWEPIISEDVDGPNSLPLEIDRANTNLGRYSACRRVARTLYMGTAPGSTGKNPGVDDRRIRLGCTQPGEHTATFGDALRKVSDRAKHIHQDGNRYWISTKANLNRLADDRAAALMAKPEELHAEVVRHIREECKPKPNRGEFAGVHPCPESSAEVHDEPEARLVILGPQYPHRKGHADTAGMKFARALLDKRGNSPRLNRNMLLFLAPDSVRLDELLHGVAQHLAWKSIFDEQRALNLDEFQRRQAEAKAKDTTDTVEARIKETWTLALVPVPREPEPGAQARPEDLVGMDEVRIQGNDPLAKRTSTKLRNDGTLATTLAGANLRLHMDKHLWRDKNHVAVGQLAEWFARHLYLPRIVNQDVLVAAVLDGLKQMLPEQTFALAAGFDDATGRYRGLQVRPSSPVIDNGSLVVKTEVARRQIGEDEKPKCPSCSATAPEWNPAAGICGKCGYRPIEPVRPTCPKCEEGEPVWTESSGRCSKCGFTRSAKVTSCPRCGAKTPVWNASSGRCAACEKTPPPKKKPNLFVGCVKLDSSRLGRDAGKIAEEVLQHLSTLPNANAEVRLEIQVRVPDGVPDDIMRTVSENARTLKFETAGFEEG